MGLSQIFTLDPTEQCLRHVARCFYRKDFKVFFGRIHSHWNPEMFSLSRTTTSQYEFSCHNYVTLLTHKTNSHSPSLGISAYSISIQVFEWIDVGTHRKSYQYLPTHMETGVLLIDRRITCVVCCTNTFTDKITQGGKCNSNILHFVLNCGPIEFSRNTQSCQCWHFCTTSNVNKLETVKKLIHLKPNLHLPWCFEL